MTFDNGEFMYYAPYYIDAPVNLTAHFIVCILNVKVALSPDALHLSRLHLRIVVSTGSTGTVHNELLVCVF